MLAVLETRCGLALAGYDVYLNVAGGLRIGEPAADLAVAAALVSSRSNVPVPDSMVIFGEIGLSGEIRAVAQEEQRLKEAAKLGFAEAVLPPRRQKRPAVAGMKTREVAHLQDLIALLAASGQPGRGVPERPAGR